MLRSRRLSHRVARRAIMTVISASILASAAPVFALQPIETFLEAAKTSNPDVRIATAVAEQRDAEADVALGNILPSFYLKGAYTRNENSADFPVKFLNPNATTADIFGANASKATIALIPTDQVDGYVGLNITVIDVAAWDRRAAATSLRDAAKADEDLTRNDVARQVTRSYYQLVAEEAVLRASRRNVEVAQQNVTISKTRKQGGTASTVDIDRGVANVALAQQDVASATLAVATTKRALESLTGIAPEASTSFTPDDLHEEAALSTWTGETSKNPLVVSARLSQEAAENAASAASAEWIPKLNATANYHVTNAPGFSDNTAYYTIQAVASWQVGLQTAANARAQNAAAAAAAARADKVKRQAEDIVHADWYQVRACIDRARASRAQLAAATGAADLVRERYSGGLQTELEVLQAQEDAFRADVSRIQADADLAYARAALRLDSAAMTAEKSE